MEPDSEYVTPVDAAKIIGVTRQQVDNYIRSGRLRCMEIRSGGGTKEKVVVRLIKREDASLLKNDRPEVGRPTKKSKPKKPKTEVKKKKP